MEFYGVGFDDNNVKYDDVVKGLSPQSAGNMLAGMAARSYQPYHVNEIK